MRGADRVALGGGGGSDPVAQVHLGPCRVECLPSMHLISDNGSCFVRVEEP